MNSRLIKHLLFFLLAIVLCSCSIAKDDVYGTYISEYNIAKEELTLNKDGTYVQKVTLSSTLKVNTANGFWTYNEKKKYVTFQNNFMLVLDGFGKLNPNYDNPKKGLVIVPIYFIFGNIEMGSHEGVLYKKSKKN